MIAMMLIIITMVMTSMIIDDNDNNDHGGFDYDRITRHSSNDDKITVKYICQKVLRQEIS